MPLINLPTPVIYNNVVGACTSTNTVANGTYIVVTSSDGIVHSTHIVDTLGRTQLITGTANGTYIISNTLTSGTCITPYYNNITSASTTSIWTGASTWYTSHAPSVYVPPKPDYRKIRFDRNNARKALWKSVRLFENLFGLNKIQLFMNGQAFEISGRKFDYRISKNSYGLIEHTQNPNTSHIPYKLEILNKKGVVLSQGCTVFKKTPIVDQITALLLHITSGEEEHVLKNCNLFNIKRDFYEDQESLTYFRTLHKKKYERDYVTGEQLVGVPTQRQDLLEIQAGVI